jgi:hypothetical protein
MFSLMTSNRLSLRITLALVINLVFADHQRSSISKSSSSSRHTFVTVAELVSPPSILNIQFIILNFNQCSHAHITSFRQQPQMPLEERDTLQERVAKELKKDPGKQRAIKLDRLDTTIPSYHESNRSSALSSISDSARSFSASRLRSGKAFPRTPLQMPRVAHQQLQPEKPLPERPRPGLSPRERLSQLLPSPLFALQPPLSARSVAFIVSLQHMLSSTVDAYVSHRYSGPPIKSPASKDDPHEGEKQVKDTSALEAQVPKETEERLKWWRKLLIAFCTMSMLTIIVLLIICVRIDHMGVSLATQWLMGGSGAFVVFAAIAMFAARLPLVSILVMAVLGVLICQCVMDHFHARTK